MNYTVLAWSLYLQKGSPNFLPAEKSHLIGIIGNKYSKIIEDKKTDTSLSDKIQA